MLGNLFTQPLSNKGKPETIEASRMKLIGQLEPREEVTVFQELSSMGKNWGEIKK